MKTTLNLDSDLLDRARELSQIQGKTALVHAGLRALIAVVSRERLAKLGGSEKRVKAVRRRRSAQVAW